MVVNIPKWLQSALNKQGADQIEEAVHKAEERTTGEIVPLLVQGSTLNASAPLLAVFIAGFLVLALKHGLWLYDVGQDVSVWAWCALFVATACGGFAFGTSPIGQMLLTPRWEKRRQVQQRALLAFYEAGLNKTTGRTGILLFVSWRERQAIVLADEGIAKHCEPSVFEHVVQELVRGAKEGQLGTGFARAVELSADILAQHLPLQPGDSNELKNHLRIID